MANLSVKNAAGTAVDLKATGDGSATPFSTDHTISDGTDMLAINADGSINVSGVATATNQTAGNTLTGAVTETAPASDTASSGLNGRLQRIAQRLTSLIALLPTSLGQKAKTASLAVVLASDQDALPITDNSGSLTVDGTVSVTGTVTVDGSGTTQPVSAVSLPLPSGASTAANQATGNASLSSLETKIGEVQASPTANTVLDRLKAITTAITGTLTVATHAVTQSGTWTVQPGNTANTTAWKVDGSAVTQPISAAALPLPSGAATAAKQPALGTAGSASTDVITVQGIASGTAQPVSDAGGSLTVDSPGLPTALGSTTAAASMPVALSTDGTFATLSGAVTETAPASDTASSGLNGRLQRIAQRLTSLIALLPTSLGQKTMANGLAVTVASDQTAIPISDNSGSITVDTPDTVITITPTLDTSAYAAGDLFFDTTAITSAVTANGGVAILNSIHILDEDDQGPTLQFVFLDTNNSLGTINAAPSISDTNARKIIGTISNAIGTWIDIGDCRIMTITNIGMVLKADAASSNLHVAAITSSVTTQTASGVRVQLGFLR
jgi:hypothetical protein